MSVETFVLHLHYVHNSVQARGELRRGLPMAGPHLWPHIDEQTTTKIDDYALIGSLFAEYPGLPGGQSLGLAYQAMAEAAPNDGAKKMYERRFSGLLDASRDALPQHLRHAVALCARARQPIDWKQLLTDVLAWSDDDRHVQRRLAREMWG